MREKLKRSWFVSVAGLVSSTILLSSCSAPDRLSNDDISLDKTKSIVKERLISPVDDERIVEFNKKLPRRSILQVIHSSQSLTDPSFLQIVEEQLSDEINFRKLQDDLAGEEELPVRAPKKLSEAEKNRIIENRAEARNAIMSAKASALEDALYLDLDAMELEAEALFLLTVPLTANKNSFPEIIGANLTEDPNGYLTLPADVVLIGGQGSTLTSKTADLAAFIDDREISLSVRDIPLAEALGIIAGSMGLEYTISESLLTNDSSISLSLRANGLSILDAILTQNDLAIMYDGALDIARFYTDDELGDIEETIKDAIRGYNELLYAQRKLDRAQADVDRIKKMIDISQRLLTGDFASFNNGVRSFPRQSMSATARGALQTLTNEHRALSNDLKEFDTRTTAMLNPSDEQISTGLNRRINGMSVSDMLVENSCIEKGQELFVEKIAVYNVNGAEAVEHLQTYFAANNELNETDDQPQGDNEGAAADGADGDDAIAAPPSADPQDQANTVALDQSNCPDYEISFQEDSTGVIVKGRRADNSLAVRLVEEFDVPKLQVLVEIFMVTVSRDFNRQISNLITAAAGAAGGNGVVEAGLIPGGSVTDPTNVINEDLLRNISSAVAGGYSVRLNSPKLDGDGNSLISSALSFLERNQLGRVLSSPTILVEHGTEEAFIDRTQSALVPFVTPGTTTTDEDGVETTTPATTEIETYEAPFRLTLNDVKVFPANRTVSMDVKIESTRFLIPNIELITDRDQADFIRDEISTAFTASPGDVIVLAGLSANSEGATTAGLPGTTAGLAPVSPLLGGSDQVTNNVNEMIIFMAPTVIDPSAEFQPHSAFGKTSDKANSAEDDATASDAATE